MFPPLIMMGTYTALWEGFNMRRRFVYFYLCVKKTLRLVPLFILTALLIMAVTVFALKNVGEDRSVIKIGICGDIDGMYLNIASAFLKNSGEVEIVAFDSEEQAMSSLKKGDIQGFATVPKGFIDMAMSGNNIPLTFTTVSSPAKLSQAITQEIISILSPVVYNSQNAVFGMRRYLSDIGQYRLANAETDKMMAEYILTLIQRDKLFDVTVVGISDGVGIRDYYKGALWVLFVVLCGVIAQPRMKHDSCLSALLVFGRLGVISQVLCEWTAYTLTVCIASVLSCIAIFGNISAVLGILPAMILLTAMQFLIFELSPSIISGSVLHFFIAVITSYISGLFYPSYFFPHALQEIGKILPVGQAFKLVKQTLSDTVTVDTVAVAVIISVILIALAMVKRRIEMRGGRI